MKFENNMKSLYLFLLLVSPFYLFSQQVGKYYYGGYSFRIQLNSYQCLEYFKEPKPSPYDKALVNRSFILLNECELLYCNTIGIQSQGLDFDMIEGKRVDKPIFFWDYDSLTICELSKYSIDGNILGGGSGEHIQFKRGYRDYFSLRKNGIGVHVNMLDYGDIFSVPRHSLMYRSKRDEVDFYYYGSKNFKDIEAMKPLLFQYLGRNGYLYFFTDDGGVVILDKKW
jgi:hypothetical protein